MSGLNYRSPFASLTVVGPFVNNWYMKLGTLLRVGTTNGTGKPPLEGILLEAPNETDATSAASRRRHCSGEASRSDCDFDKLLIAKVGVSCEELSRYLRC